MSTLNATDKEWRNMSDNRIGVQLLEGAIAEKEASIQSKVGTDLEDLQVLQAELKKLTRGSAKAGPAVADETLVEAVGTLGKGGKSHTSPEIAKHLDVDVRQISRKLAKLAEDGKIKGDKDAGYAPTKF